VLLHGQIDIWPSCVGAIYICSSIPSVVTRKDFHSRCLSRICHTFDQDGATEVCTVQKGPATDGKRDKFPIGCFWQ
jgi:hypothetical protein